MPLTLNNTNTLTADNIIVSGTNLSDLYATINYVNSNSGGVSQQDVDDSLEPLISKDIAYNNTITSHISLIDTSTADIAILNTKQLQNFNGINDINTNLTNNYQTNTTLATNFYNKTEIDSNLSTNYQTNTQLTSNFYSKTEIDTTLDNYYTSLQVDNGFYTQTQINNNYYNKTETDNLIDNLAVYSQTEVDAFLSYKEDKSRFQDNISFFPIIDCSRPTILHAGLTLKNETINIEPLEGALFGNLFGAETDRNVATFKNQSNYITLKGNKINCNATSDDSVDNLKLNMAGNIEFSNVILPAIGADLYRPSGNSSYNLRIRDLQGIWEFRNRTLTCRNASNENLDALMEIQSLGQGQVRIGTATTARVGIGATPNSSYFLNVGGHSRFGIATIATRLDLLGDLYTDETGTDIFRPSATTSYTLRVRDNVATFEFRNNKFGRTNGQMILQNDGDCELFVGTEGTARVGIGTAPNASYFLNVGGTSNFNNVRTGGDLSVVGNLNLTSSIGDIQVPVSGMDIVRNSGDANYTLRVGDTQGIWEFRNRNLRCMNPSNPANGTEMILHDTGGDYRLRIGSTSDAEVGIGRQYNSAYFLTVGGISNFNQARVENGLEVLGEQLLNTSARIFQRADAFNSLNVITTAQMNFSLQSDRTTDPTTGTIALQLDDANGITINRAVVNNQTFNSLGDITSEADVVSYGKFKLQNAGEIREVLDTQYKMYVRNGDGAGEMNIMVGAEVSTPEIKITDAKVNLLGHLEITHGTVSTSEKVKYNNPDTDGAHLFSLNNANKFTIEETTCDVYNNLYVDGDVEYTGSLIPSSDERLKKNIKELNQKKAVELVKYIKPKTYKFTDDRQQGRSCCGFIANDFLTDKVPDEWQNIVKKGNDDYLKFDYTMTTPILWSALQHTLKEIDELKKEVRKLKGKGKGDGK